jgi:hypothetical protein
VNTWRMTMVMTQARARRMGKTRHDGDVRTDYQLQSRGAPRRKTFILADMSLTLISASRVIEG